MKKAPKLMDDGIRRIKQEGRTVTVEELCREVRNNVGGFLDMSESAGVLLEWYENLARERMEAFGL